MNLKINLSFLLAITLGFSFTFIESCSKRPDIPPIDCQPADDNAPFDNDDDDCSGITEKDYEKLLSKLGPLSLTVKKGEGNECSEVKECELTATFSLHSIAGCEVDNSVKEKSKVTVQFDKNGSTGDESHLCPLDNKQVVLNMSLTYKGNIIEASDRSVLLEGRVDKRTVMVGVSEEDKGSYNFFNVNTKITQLSCPESRRLQIKNICEDINLYDEKLRECWVDPESDNNICPSLGDNSKYPVNCR